MRDLGVDRWEQPRVCVARLDLGGMQRESTRRET